MTAGLLTKWFTKGEDLQKTNEQWQHTMEGRTLYEPSHQCAKEHLIPWWDTTWQGPSGILLTFVADDVRLTIKTSDTLTYGRLIEIARHAAKLSNLESRHHNEYTGSCYSSLQEGEDQFTFVVIDLFDDDE